MVAPPSSALRRLALLVLLLAAAPEAFEYGGHDGCGVALFNASTEIIAMAGERKVPPKLIVQPLSDMVAPIVALIKTMEAMDSRAMTAALVTGSPRSTVGSRLVPTSSAAAVACCSIAKDALVADNVTCLPCDIVHAPTGSPPRPVVGKGKLGSSPTRIPGKAVRRNAGDQYVPILGSSAPCMDFNLYRCPVCERDFKSHIGFTKHKTSGLEMEGCKQANPVVINPTEERVAQTVSQLQSDAQQVTYESTMRETMVGKLGEFLYSSVPTPRSHVDEISQMVGEVALDVKAEVYKRLHEHISEGQLNSLFGVEPSTGNMGIFEPSTGNMGIFDVRRGIETAAKEETVRSDLHHPVEPQKRMLYDPDGERTGDHVYDVPLSKELQAWVRQTPGLMAEMSDADRRWSEVAASKAAPTSLTDLTDGAVFRNHPELGAVRAADDESLRLAFTLYYDDVEVTNPLGAFTGTHKLALFYWVVLNVDASKRMALHNIHLATVALEHDLAYYGPKQVVSGAPLEAPAEARTGTAFGEQMRALDKGISLRLPSADPTDPFEHDVELRGWLVCLAADYPAAALLTGMKKSVAAHAYCRECDINQSLEGYPDAHSFVRPEKSNLKQLVNLRNAKTHLDCARCAAAKPSAKARDAYLASIGVNTFDHAFVDIPHFDVCSWCPQDFMHVECEGLLKLELAAVIFYMVRCVHATTLEAINQAIYNYQWEGGAANRPPYFTDGILEGTRPPAGSGIKAMPKQGCHVHMTAGDTLRFTLHSTEVLGPLLGKHTSSKVWQCWLKHVHYVSVLMQHQITEAQIQTLDQLIFEHQEAFLSIPEYSELYKPKHHFATHFPIDIRNFGPPRHYWCMRFESLNQVFKTIAVGGSYRDTTRRCAKIWCSKTAHDRYHSKFDGWGATRVVRSGGTIKYDRQQLDPSDWVVEVIFESGPPIVANGQTHLQIEWIDVLQHSNGMSFYAGQSWVHVTVADQNADDDTERCCSVVGRLEKRSILRIDGRFYFAISQYPSLKPDSDGMPFVTVPTDFEPEIVLMPLDALTSLTSLWPKEKAGGEKGMRSYRFIPKG